MFGVECFLSANFQWGAAGQYITVTILSTFQELHNALTKSHADVSTEVSLQMESTNFNKKGPQIMGN